MTNIARAAAENGLTRQVLVNMEIIGSDLDQTGIKTAKLTGKFKVFSGGVWYNNHVVVIIPAHTGFCDPAESRALKSSEAYRVREVDTV